MISMNIADLAGVSRVRDTSYVPFPFYTMGTNVQIILSRSS